MLKTYKLKYFGHVYELAPVVCSYQNNDVLAIDLIDVSDGEDFGVITVNLPKEDFSDSFSIDDCSYIDCNNYDFAEQFIEDNQLGFPTGFYGVSGFSIYPLYSFNLSKLNTFEDVVNHFNGGKSNA